MLSTIRLYAVTSGELEGSTFVEWSGHFSNDADAGKFVHTLAGFLGQLCTDGVAGVIQDAKFKRRDALADLGKAAAKM